MLVVKNLIKSYHNQYVLKGVSFEVQKGETLGIVGENGVGKTTLLRIISCISSCDNGYVYLNGSPLLLGPAKVRKSLLYLGHEPSLYPVLTAEENLLLVARLYQQSVTRDKIIEILKDVNLSRRSETPIRLFSKGMLQRLNLAKAYVVPWQILLLDEPSAGLDESGLTLLEGAITRWQKEKRTLLLVSHHLTWIQNFSTRILELKNGVTHTKISS